MGAHSCEDYLIGPDLDEAFRQARRAAEYEHGHDPYNGTISTAAGVVEMPIDLGRIPVGRIVRAAWALTRISDDAKADKELRRIKVPARLFAQVKKIAWQLDGSKGDYWPALRVPASMERKLKERHGRKGTQDHVWVVFGWAAS